MHAPVGAQELSLSSSPAHPVSAEQAPEPNLFAQLGLAKELLQAIAAMGFTQPTAVQQSAISSAQLGQSAQTGTVNYRDLMVSSQTGSGKTAAFLLPVLHTILETKKQQELDRLAQLKQDPEAGSKKAKRRNPTDPRNFKTTRPTALVLCPTRELAQQVAQDAIDLVRFCKGLRVASVVGGMPYQLQIARLQNADLVVATPGRLLDLTNSGQIGLEGVQFLVMDEADRMLDLGFADDLAAIHQLTEQRRQTMMFSATLAPRIQQLGMRVMHEGGKHVHRIEIDSPQDKHVNITQKLYWADHPKHKRALLDHFLRDTAINQAIVFASTQIECEALAEDLQQEGFVAVSLHGALSQSVRNRRLMALRDGRVQILVATDVAARGIDVPTITHVINYGLPMKAEDYTHRIGRTGRAGRAGLALTLAEPRDRRRIMDIEAYTKHRIPVDIVAGLEPTVRSPMDVQKPRGKGYGKPAGRHAAPRGGGFAQPRSGERDHGQVRGFGNKRPANGPKGADAPHAAAHKKPRRPFMA